MLRKRTRSVEKDQPMGHPTTSDIGSQSCLSSDIVGKSQKFNNFFNIPGLFVGLSPKGLLDSDSVRSPTSPLDFKVFSNLCNSPRSPKSPCERNQKIWDKSKVGLSIVDCLDNDLRVNGNALKSSESKNILFGSRMRIMTSDPRNHAGSFEAPKSLPNNFPIFPQALAKSRLRRGNNTDVVFEITDTPLGSECTGKAMSCSLDSGRSFVAFSGLPNRYTVNGATKTGPNTNILAQTKLNSTPSEIELSEDYTCVTLHGSNPKTTHIYGDCVLNCHSNATSDCGNMEALEVKAPQTVQCLEILAPHHSNDFLSFCYSCNKKLEHGKDIYIYRGEKAFCSSECRSKEMLIDEELEESMKDTFTKPPEVDKDEELFETSIFVVT